MTRDKICFSSYGVFLLLKFLFKLLEERVLMMDSVSIFGER